MKAVDGSMLASYLEVDRIQRACAAATEDADAAFASQRWLAESAPKRLVFDLLYGDLLEGGACRRVLDVGGGYTALTRILAARHDYSLVDIMAHDDHGTLAAIEERMGKRFWVESDWMSYEPDGALDLVVANDLFPNVDQRLGAFLEKYVPLCRELRLSLTVYNEPRYYQVKRVDADEVLWMLAWDGERTAKALEPYRDRIAGFDETQLLRSRGSLWPNGRQVVAVSIGGGGG